MAWSNYTALINSFHTINLHLYYLLYLTGGKSSPPHLQNLISNSIVCIFFIALIVFPISNFYATSLLNDRGYILCPRVLGESVVGGGRTWALSDELCLKDRLERESSTRNRLSEQSK